MKSFVEHKTVAGEQMDFPFLFPVQRVIAIDIRGN